MAGARRRDEPPERLFAEGGFFTRDGKARFVAVAPPRLARRHVGRLAVPAQHRPRARPVAHHDAHGAVAAPVDPHRRAVRRSPSRRRARLGLEQGALARVTTAHGEATLRVLVSRGQQPGTPVRADPLVGARTARRRRIGALVHGRHRSVLRPARGQGDAGAHCPAARRSISASCCRAAALRPGGLAYWASARTPFGHLLHFALDTPGEGWAAGNRLRWAQEIASALPTPPRASIAMRCCATAGWKRSCSSARARSCPRPTGSKPNSSGRPFQQAERRALLAGRPVDGAADEGPIVCVCFQVGARPHRRGGGARAAGRWRRSGASSAPAPTAAPASPRSGA